MSERRHWVWLIAAAALFGGTSAAADPPTGGTGKLTYRWVDAQGHVHYSDRVPPEAAHQQYSEVDQNGLTRKQIEREKSAEEAAASERAAQQAAQQASYDRYLLQTYPHIEDLEAAFEAQLQVLDQRSVAAHRAVSQNQATLADLHSRSAIAESEGSDAVQELKKNIATVEATGRDADDALVKLDAERKATLARFGSDVQRYRELTGAPAAAHAPPPAP